MKNFKTLQRRLHESIEVNGIGHVETIRLSQELDKEVLKLQKTT